MQHVATNQASLSMARPSHLGHHDVRQRTAAQQLTVELHQCADCSASLALGEPDIMSAAMGL
jgi:hypothetical protein